MTAQFGDIKNILLYFISDKQFVIYDCTETNWNDSHYQELVANKKVIVKTTYDGLPEDAIIVQAGRTENDLSPALKYCRDAKKIKKLTIESIMKQVKRFRTEGRQAFPTIQVK